MRLRHRRTLASNLGIVFGWVKTCSEYTPVSNVLYLEVQMRNWLGSWHSLSWWRPTASTHVCGSTSSLPSMIAECVKTDNALHEALIAMGARLQIGLLSLTPHVVWQTKSLQQQQRHKSATSDGRQLRTEHATTQETRAFCCKSPLVIAVVLEAGPLGADAGTSPGAVRQRQQHLPVRRRAPHKASGVAAETGPVHELAAVGVQVFEHALVNPPEPSQCHLTEQRLLCHDTDLQINC